MLGNNLYFLIAILFLDCNQSSNSNTKKEVRVTSISKINSQEKANLLLEKKIKLADTILLISHTGIVYDTVTQKETLPELVIHNKINRKILREQKVLTENDINSLTQILLMPTNDSDVIYSRCYYPHHAILIINKGNISYIDLCFHCFSLSTSEDLKLIEGYNEPKWEALVSFYRKLGFKYKMP